MESKSRKASSKRVASLPARWSRPRFSFAFAACLGIWLPQTDAAVLVDLDATQLPEGPLSSWKNSGSTAGDFVAPATAIPNVATVGGVKGVTLNGTTQYFTGPAAPVEVTGGGPRTIEAWILNPAAANEETIFAWGRRGGPNGSNVSFNHGTNPTFGAVGHWGTPDIGWNGRLVAGRWTYVAYTYDGITATVYSDGEVANSEDVALDTWAFDNTDAGNPLPFRVGSQNEANGNPTGGLRGSMTIAKIRVHDESLPAATIKANFDAAAASFGLGDQDNDGLPSWYENQFAFLNPTEPADAARDEDSDGLTNRQEFEAGTAPDQADSDGDGISDSAELNRVVAGQPAPTDPLRSDSDNDGLPDGAETGTGTFVGRDNAGTDPLKPDTDDDTFGDLQEALYGSNPNVAQSVPPADRPPVVHLDATSQPVGPLNTWPNIGAIGGEFAASPNVASVQNVQGVAGVTLNGANNTGHFYTGPAAPAFMTGNASRTIEAWVHNPQAAVEETIFAWGRRGGPDGTNASYLHGTNPTWGAAGHWGAQHDIGWEDATLPPTGVWHFYTFVYDSATMTAHVYSNGVEVNAEEWTDPLNTHATDSQGRPLPFRVGSQNNDNGNPTPNLRGSMTIAEVRVYDRALDASTVLNHFNTGTDKFGLVDYDNDSLPTWYERQFDALDERNPADAAQDSDNDGLTNLEEFQGGTPPNNPDADGDGLKDGDEVKTHLTLPLRPDTDGDGLNDGQEITGGTAPTNPDTDADGFADGLEVFLNSNPQSASSLPSFATPVALIDLDATGLPVGPLNLWTNNGPLGGVFVAPEGGAATVETVQGVKGATLDGISDYYTGPAAPVFFAGDASRTIEAWVHNPAVAEEETIFAWGRRGGPDGSNASYLHGTHPVWGAAGHWGAQHDVGWSDATLPPAGQWHHYTFVYDNVTQMARVYSNGVEVNAEQWTDPLDTHAVDTADRPLPFRLGAQNEADGSANGPLRGSMTIAKLRVYPQALDAQTILAKFNQERDAFTSPPQGLEIESATFDPVNRSVTIRWTAVAGQTYTVEASSNLTDWTQVATGLTEGTFTEPIAGGGPVRFYRLRAQ